MATQNNVDHPESSDTESDQEGKVLETHGTLVEKVDHQLEVDGVIYRELRTINRVVSQVFLQIFN